MRCKKHGCELLFWTWGCHMCADPNAPRWRTFFTPYTFTAAELSTPREGLK